MLHSLYLEINLTNTYLGVPQFVLAVVYIQGAQKLL